MRIVSRAILQDFADLHADAKGHLDAWWHFTKRADWSSPQAIKNEWPKASIVADNRVVFDIVGGKYRLVVKFNYPYRMGYIRFIGTHAEYDKIDVTKI